MRTALAKSNVYNALHTVYTDLGVFGTSPMLVDVDREDGMRGYVLPIGQYALANSDRMKSTPSTASAFTNAQLAAKFGLEACSPRVREALQRGQLDAWAECCTSWSPTPTTRRGSSAQRQEVPQRVDGGADGTHESFLAESGYSTFPCWPHVGTSPARTSMAAARAWMRSATSRRCKP